ncbi:GEVED domain-containing protein [Planctomycetota bacterium]
MAVGTLPVPLPPNDDCYNAEVVSNVIDLSFETTSATFDGPGHFFTSPNIWYLYRAGSTGYVTVSLLNSEFDTALVVYDTSDCYPEWGDVIERNDDFGGFLQSQITFQATFGNQYLFEVLGYSSDDVGEGVLTISSEGEPPATNNDECHNAKPIGDVTELPFDTTSATQDGPHHCMHSSNLWYCYTASCTGEATVSLAGSSYDTMLAVYDGCECYPTLNDMIECNDDSNFSLQSEIVFNAIAGNQYLIEVGGYSLEAGHGLLSFSCEGVVTPQRPDLGDAPDSTNNHNRGMLTFPEQEPPPLLVPANYPTVFDDGSGVGPYGPAHLNPLTVAYLGKKVTRESEADTGPDEDGINNIRPSARSSNHDKGDDGVVFPLNLSHCNWTTFDYFINIIDPNTDLWINVWCDWNRDGDWDDTLTCNKGPSPEWAVQNQFLFNLPVGLNQLTTPAFLSFDPKNDQKEIWMRITLSEQPWRGGSNPNEIGNGGSGPQTKYEFGETEDYYFAPDITSSICQDYNGDGVIDMEDIEAFTAEWLENCP